MTAISRSGVSIWIESADTAGSALVASNAIDGEITSWSLSGGNQDVESVAAFGGFIDKEKPREQFELSMDVTPKLSTTASITDRWDIYKFGSLGISTGEGADKVVYIQATDGTSFKSFGFNNARAVTWEPSHDADDNMGGTLTWKFSPENETGISNLRTSAIAATTSTGAYFNDWSVDPS